MTSLISVGRECSGQRGHVDREVAVLFRALVSAEMVCYLRNADQIPVLVTVPFRNMARRKVESFAQV